MLKEKIKLIFNVALKHSKWLLPALLIVVVAITVSVALKANDTRTLDTEVAGEGLVSVEAEELSEDKLEEVAPTPAPMEENTNSDLHTLVCTYYNAYAYGDIETLKSISNYVEDTEEITILEMSQYVDSYPELTIYTKPGPIENSYLAYVYYKMKVIGFEEAISGMETFYVCTDDNGTMYLSRGEVSEEEREYIQQASLQDDVVELYNRATVECSDALTANEALYYYIQEIVKEVQKATGETLAAQIAGTEGTTEGGDAGAVEEAQTTEVTGEQSVEAAATPVPETPVSTEPIYAKATTTVNVRSSDSEQADKVDKITGGTKVEVLEQKVNGWSKVSVNGVEGYIKSEYLLVISANAGDAIGTVTAISNVNVRSSASESGKRIGLLSGGTTVDLLGTENGWCKINYGGQVGYVKADFVQ